jgi:hypothetical protein
LDANGLIAIPQQIPDADQRAQAISSKSNASCRPLPAVKATKRASELHRRYEDDRLPVIRVVEGCYHVSARERN